LRIYLRKSAGSFAIFAAIRRASSRVSGLVFSFEHLAARLKNRHHGLVDREHIKSDRICLSCGKANLAGTIPGIGEPLESRT
jgi:hypothetical protein